MSCPELIHPKTQRKKPSKASACLYCCDRKPRVLPSVRLLSAHHRAPHVYKPSELVNEQAYHADRSQDINTDESLNWTSPMIKLLQDADSDADKGSMFETAIRRGIPDALKGKVFLLAQSASFFKAQNPKYYNEQLHHTFGAKIPSDFRNRVPTFSGGFLGIEEEILGTPLDVDQLEVLHGFNIRRSEVSWTDINLVMASEGCSSLGRSSSLEYFSDEDPYDSHVTDSGLNYRSYLKTTLADRPVCLGTTEPRGASKANRVKNTFLPSGDLSVVSRGKSPSLSLSPASSRAKYHPSPLRPDILPQHQPLTPHRCLSSDIPVSSSLPLSRASADTTFSASSKQHARWSSRWSPWKWFKHNAITQRSHKKAGRQKRSHHHGAASFGVASPNVVKQSNIASPHTSDAFGAKALSSASFETTRERDVYRVESITHLHRYLSDRGLLAVKRMLWCLSATFPDIEFCPLLPNLLCVCLLYLSEPDTFVLMTCLFKAAREATCQQSEIPILTYRRTEYVRFVKFVVAVAAKYLPKLMQHLASLQMDVAAWMAKIMADGLVRVVSFDPSNTFAIDAHNATILSTEGAKVIQRYCLAILKINEHQLFRCTHKSEAEQILLSTRYRTKPNDINLLTKIAFRVSIKWTKGGITKYTSYDLPTPFLTGVKVQRFYRPRLRESSNILPDVDWEYVWAWLPHTCRILDPFLSWRSDRDGMSLLALEKKLHHVQGRPMVFLVLTRDTNEIIGGFCEGTFTSHKKLLESIDPSSTCLFQVHPTPNAYWWTGVNQTFIDFSADRITIGGDNIALYIDRDIYHGRSQPSLSFNSPQLAGDALGDFVISAMEGNLQKMRVPVIARVCAERSLHADGTYRLGTLREPLIATAIICCRAVHQKCCCLLLCQLSALMDQPPPNPSPLSTKWGAEGHRVVTPTAVQSKEAFQRQLHELLYTRPLVIHTHVLPPGIRPDDPRLPHAKVLSEQYYIADYPIIPDPTFTVSFHPALISPAEPQNRIVVTQMPSGIAPSEPRSAL